MTQTLHIFVTGRVQGVFYRASAQREARRLGITGYARNLPDGRVEIVAQGQTAALQAFIDWCRQGPPRAEVTDVSSKPYTSAETFSHFAKY
jgi:acylphosphatase